MPYQDKYGILHKSKWEALLANFRPRPINESKNVVLKAAAKIENRLEEVQTQQCKEEEIIDNPEITIINIEDEFSKDSGLEESELKDQPVTGSFCKY